MGNLNDPHLLRKMDEIGKQLFGEWRVMNRDEAEKIQRDSMHRSYEHDVTGRLQEVGEDLLTIQRRINEEEAARMEQGMTNPNWASPGIGVSDSRGEVERLLDELYESLSRLEEQVQRTIERTSSVAAMDRSIPQEGDDVVSRHPETQVGTNIAESIARVNHVNNRLNEHLYKLEL